MRAAGRGSQEGVGGQHGRGEAKSRTRLGYRVDREGRWQRIGAGEPRKRDSESAVGVAG